MCRVTAIGLMSRLILEFDDERRVVLSVRTRPLDFFKVLIQILLIPGISAVIVLTPSIAFWRCSGVESAFHFNATTRNDSFRLPEFVLGGDYAQREDCRYRA